MIQTTQEIQPQREDTNIYGNVHGGTIIKLMCDTSYQAVLQYLSTHVEIQTQLFEICALKNLDYLKPIRPGDILFCTCTLEEKDSTLSIQSIVYRNNEAVAKGTVLFKQYS